MKKYILWGKKKEKVVKPRPILCEFEVVLKLKDGETIEFLNVIRTLPAGGGRFIIVLSDFTSFHISENDLKWWRSGGGHQTWMDKEGIHKDAEIVKPQ